MTKVRALNAMQEQAAQAGEGHYLVLAGAGSGKTTVLTQRAVRLIREWKAKPEEILSITFTNKAAREMKERIARQAEDINLRDMWTCTFHSMCVRILRMFPQTSGFTASFAIYDNDDSMAVLNTVLDEADDMSREPKLFRMRISQFKNSREALWMQEAEIRGDAQSLSMLYTDGGSEHVFGEWHNRHCAPQEADDPAYLSMLYDRYMEALRRENAMDFDDLLLNGRRTVIMDANARASLQERFRYIMVDEYQDTNPVQFEIVRLLQAGHGNLFCVGDDDQSIYAFRGSDISIIRGFQEHFPDAQIIRLEQNYRSTANIVGASNAVIANNTERLGKTLWTENAAGIRPIILYTDSDEDEARAVCHNILNRHDEHGEAFRDCAVLYRLRRCSKAIEDQLVRSGIPYRMIGGVSFYSRAEIRDLMAYLSILVNPQADQFAERIINTPRRGIGQATVTSICREGAQQRISFLEAARQAGSVLTGQAAERVEGFMELYDSLAENVAGRPAAAVLSDVYEKTGYKAMLEMDKKKNADRIENVGVLLSAAAQFDAEEGGSLADFVQSVSLMTDQDTASEEEDAVQVMTIHAAKGLEYDNVYVIGMGEGIFPSSHAVADGTLQEERRLCYVAMTRARRRLVMVHGRARSEFGSTKCYNPSRFLKELPQNMADTRNPSAEKRQAAAAARREALKAGAAAPVAELYRSEPFRIRGCGGGPYCIVEDEALSRDGDIRYVITDAESGDVLDDANGYGYKSEQKAMNAWRYKVRYQGAGRSMRTAVG